MSEESAASMLEYTVNCAGWSGFIEYFEGMLSRIKRTAEDGYLIVTFRPDRGMGHIWSMKAIEHFKARGFVVKIVQDEFSVNWGPCNEMP